MRMYLLWAERIARDRPPIVWRGEGAFINRSRRMTGENAYGSAQSEFGGHRPGSLSPFDSARAAYIVRVRPSSIRRSTQSRSTSRKAICVSTLFALGCR